jgi:predicted GNAT family acetyltransferase
LLDAFESLCAATADSSFERRGALTLLRYPKAPLPAFNGVIVRGDGAAAELEAALRPHDGVTALDAPATLEEARRLGLIETVELPGMVVGHDAFAAVGPPGEVADDALDEALSLLAESFGAPREWFDELYTRDVLDRAGGAAYVLRVDGRPVATALSLRTGDALGIFNVGTPAAERGKGYGAAVTAAAVERGFAAGASFAWLQSSALGFSVYRRLGFEHVNTYTLAFAPPH